MLKMIKQGDEDAYSAENGWFLYRDRDGSPDTNHYYGYWVLLDEHGLAQDAGPFRNDLAEKHGLDLYSSLDYDITD